MQSNSPLSSAGSASSAGAHRRDLHVVAFADQLDDALALGVVVLDQQQPPHLPVEERGDVLEGALQRLAG